MKSLYVIGGQQRAYRSLLADDQNWYDYQKGLILQVDPTSGDSEVWVEYVSPPQACAEGDPVLFKSGTVQGNKLYVCTQTEALIYSLPYFELVGYVSLPCFNDVHHVRPTAEGHLLVANSGLEMVLEVTLEGEILREWNVLGEDPWTRFSRAIDYRKGINTKPHRAHPNHVFYIGDDIWVTRFEQKDAVSLTRPGRRIDIGIERVHDGLLHEGLLYFTTVNGNVIIVNPGTLKIEEVVNLNEMHEEDTLLGWCRGIMIDGANIWVGFSRIRPTKFREAVSWVRVGFKRSLHTHVACYDLIGRRCITEIDLETHGLNAVFSILPGLE